MSWELCQTIKNIGVMIYRVGKSPENATSLQAAL